MTLLCVCIDHENYIRASEGTPLYLHIAKNRDGYGGGFLYPRQSPMVTENASIKGTNKHSIVKVLQFIELYDK